MMSDAQMPFHRVGGLYLQHPKMFCDLCLFYLRKACKKRIFVENYTLVSNYNLS